MPRPFNVAAERNHDYPDLRVNFRALGQGDMLHLLRNQLIDSEDDLSNDDEDNGNGNFNDYEALLNLDELIVQAIPEKLVHQLPVSKFTKNN